MTTMAATIAVLIAVAAFVGAAASIDVSVSAAHAGAAERAKAVAKEPKTTAASAASAVAARAAAVAATTKQPAAAAGTSPVADDGASASNKQRIVALATDVESLAKASAQLRTDVASTKATVEQLLKELQSVRAESKADLGKLQSEAAAERLALESRLKGADALAKALARQVSMQQLFTEERIRSDGSSGIKRVRIGKAGTKSYYTGSVVGGSAALSVHDHSNYDRIVGLGEFVGVLNGVEFRTRHNDYKFVMPSTLSPQYQATENIPYPDVPPEVLAKKTVEEQIAEMREFFRAWSLQDPKIRNYSKYFKPALCYLEGTWTYSGTAIDEPFQSDRHAIDASSWANLQDLVSFTSYTGRKSTQENYAFLPTTIADFTNDSVPVYAQWNYRILCHPLSFDVPFKALQVIDDAATRMKLGLPYSQVKTTRAARFVLGPNGNWNGANKGLFYNSMLDKMMREIPGLNNYGANITDDAHFGTSMEPGKTDTVLNAAYYHRFVSMEDRDAMGQSMQTKGFNDANLYTALTTQPKVVPKSSTTCLNKKTCKTFSQRLSYAIPLEIVFATPLQSWNPYKLAIHDKTVIVANSGNQNEKQPLSRVYNGASKDNYYLTPEEFFSGGEVDKNAADTTRSSVAVLDPSGAMHNVSSSGIRVLLPDIPGVGVVRQRYPIFPVHEEGSHTYQELEALKEMLMDQNKFGHLLRNPSSTSPSADDAKDGRSSGLTLVTSVAPKPSPHDHLVELDADDINELNAGGVVEKFTSQANGHTHVLQIRYVKVGKKLWEYTIVQCDGKLPPCWDGHDAVKEGAN